MRCFHLVCLHTVVAINRSGAARPESAGEPAFAGGALVINWPARPFRATAMACSTLVQNSMYRPEGQPASCQSRRASRAISVRWSALLCCVGFSISLSLARYVLYDGSQRCSAGFQSAISRLSNPPAHPIGGLGTPGWSADSASATSPESSRDTQIGTLRYAQHIPRAHSCCSSILMLPVS